MRKVLDHFGEKLAIRPHVHNVEVGIVSILIGPGDSDDSDALVMLACNHTAQVRADRGTTESIKTVRCLSCTRGRADACPCRLAVDA